MENANLYNSFLTGTNLRYADLNLIYDMGGVTVNTTCPNGTNSDNDGDTCVNNLG